MSQRIVLDECLPRQLKRVFFSETVRTAKEAGLTGFKNGRLLAAISGRFDVLVTMDTSLRFQQNLARFPFGVILVKAPSNRIADLLPLAVGFRSAAASVRPGTLVEIPNSDP